MNSNHKRKTPASRRHKKVVYFSSNAAHAHPTQRSQKGFKKKPLDKKAMRKALKSPCLPYSSTIFPQSEKAITQFARLVVTKSQQKATTSNYRQLFSPRGQKRVFGISLCIFFFAVWVFSSRWGAGGKQVKDLWYLKGREGRAPHIHVFLSYRGIRDNKGEKRGQV